MKEINLKKSLYDLTEEYPELVPALAGLGFPCVGNPILRASHGKLMTIPDGCRRNGLDIESIIRDLEKKGFKVLS
jgi:uncharacterized protein